MNKNRLQHLRLLCGMAFFLGGAMAAAEDKSLLEPLPDDPAASAAVTDGSTEITQKRQQNAVTSVRVKRGNNVYYVTPAEQIPSSEAGGRAAQWEILQFRPGRPNKDIEPAPPPSMPR
jgi:hypothetical protein